MKLLKIKKGLDNTKTTINQYFKDMEYILNCWRGHIECINDQLVNETINELVKRDLITIGACKSISYNRFPNYNTHMLYIREQVVAIVKDRINRIKGSN